MVLRVLRVGHAGVEAGGPVVHRVGPAGIVRVQVWSREWAMSGHARAMRPTGSIVHRWAFWK